MATASVRKICTRRGCGKVVPRKATSCTCSPGEDARVAWQARWRDPNGQAKSKRFDRKVDADDHATSVEHKMLSGSYVVPGRETFKEYAEAWRAIQIHRPSTTAYVETMLRLHVYPVFGSRPIGTMTRTSEIQAWVRGLPLEPSSALVVYRYVSAILSAAVEDRLLTSSPCSQAVKLPAVEPTLVVPPTTEEVQAAAAAVPDRYRALVITAAGTGLRPGELFAVELPHVDFLRRTLKVEQQLILLPGAPPYIGPPKTKASYRTVPLPQVVVDALAVHLAAYPVAQVAMQDRRGKEPVQRTAGLLFTDEEGRPIRRTSWARVWRPAVAKAKLPHGTRLHNLRHYYASLLIRHGESVKVVQARLGHASASETLNTYSHLWPDSEGQTRTAVDSVLGADLAELRADDGT